MSHQLVHTQSAAVSLTALYSAVVVCCIKLDAVLATVLHAEHVSCELRCGVLLLCVSLSVCRGETVFPDSKIKPTAEEAASFSGECGLQHRPVGWATTDRLPFGLATALCSLQNDALGLSANWQTPIHIAC